MIAALLKAVALDLLRDFAKKRLKKFFAKRLEKRMNKQFLEGKLTYIGLSTAAVSYVLEKTGIVADICAAVPALQPCNSAVVGGVLVGLGIAVYGNFRKRFRKPQ